MKAKISLIAIMYIIILITACTGPQTITPKEDAVGLANKAIGIVTANPTDPDSLRLAAKMLDRAIALAPESLFIYGQKAQVLCSLGEYDQALTMLNDAENKYESFWFNMYYQAAICDFKGDTILAKLNYERVIDYCDYKLKKKGKKDPNYNNMLIINTMSKLLRYGTKAAKEDIETLKTWEEYQKDSTFRKTITGFENFDRKEYLKKLMGRNADYLKGMEDMRQWDN